MSSIRERYKESVQGWQDIYDEALDDLKFVYDVDEGQWPAGIREAREKAQRPVLTINKLQKFIRQIRGEQMINRPRIKVIPVDDKADVHMAELYNGIIRQIEYQSSSDIAYDTAYGCVIACSVGFFRLVTQYTDDNSFTQDIYIKRIVNPMAVHFDPYATEFTLSDARYCFVEELIDRDKFKRLYPKAEMIDFEDESNEALLGDWIQGDKIRVAEYFYKEPIKKTIVLLEDGRVIPLDNKQTRAAIEHLNVRILDEREVDTHVVKWKKISGAEILEEADWPGKDIPIIPVFGDEIIANGKRYYLSLARGAKGSQQIYNYWATAATETVALAPKMPFMVDHRQIKGFESEWDEANIHNRMYIRYNAISGLQKPSREPQAQIPSAIMSMMQTTAYDIEDHLGRYEASKGAASNERSGKAIIARVTQADKGTYTYVNNFTRAIVYAGRQIIDLIPKIYDTERALRIQGEDGEESLVRVNQPTADGLMNDLTVGKYDLIVTPGASFGSKREEMVNFLKEVLQYAPALSPILAPLVIKYADYPGSQEIYAELQKHIQAAQGQAQEQAQGQVQGQVQE